LHAGLALLNILTNAPGSVTGAFGFGFARDALSECSVWRWPARARRKAKLRASPSRLSPLILGAFRARGPFALVDSLYMVELKVKLERELILTSSSTHTPHALRWARCEQHECRACPQLAVGKRSSPFVPRLNELLAPIPRSSFSAHPCTSCARTLGNTGGTQNNTCLPYLTVSSVFASRTGSGALDLKERFYLLLRGQQEAHSCEGGVAEKKLFSSEQASDGREARRGSVCSSEHSWAVQAEAAPAAPAAVCGR